MRSDGGGRVAATSCRLWSVEKAAGCHFYFFTLTAFHRMPNDPADRGSLIQEKLACPQYGWDAWHFAFVTLWSGNESGLRVLEWLATAEVPPNSVLYWVDNSDGRMTERLRLEWERRLSLRFLKLVWIDGGQSYRAATGEHLLKAGRHLHVADLYNLVFSRIFEEMVVTLEDDIVPPPEGVRTLLRLLIESDRAGMAAGVYRNRVSPTDICATLGERLWRDAPRYDALPAEPFDVGMTGGGFALMPNRALQQALPLRCATIGQHVLLGWDGNFGKDLAALGFRRMVHPGVRCAHLCPEVTDYEATLLGAVTRTV
jgi:hypothetical protein